MLRPRRDGQIRARQLADDSVSARTIAPIESGEIEVGPDASLLVSGQPAEWQDRSHLEAGVVIPGLETHDWPVEFVLPDFTTKALIFANVNGDAFVSTTNTVRGQLFLDWTSASAGAQSDLYTHLQFERQPNELFSFSTTLFANNPAPGSMIVARFEALNNQSSPDVTVSAVISAVLVAFA